MSTRLRKKDPLKYGLRPLLDKTLENALSHRIAKLLSEHERKTKKIVPRRATIHDAGSGISHKWIICHKRYVEGKSSDQIARETYHSIEAVDRYLGQFDRIRHCLEEGMSTNEISHILNCSLSLVEVYMQIDEQLKDKRKSKNA